MSRVRQALGDGALAVFGGVAWLACLILGVTIGAVVGIPDRPTGVVQGREYGLSAAIPEIALTTTALLVLAYGVFFWILRRR